LASGAIASGVDVTQRTILLGGGWCSERYLIRQLLLVELGQGSVTEAVGPVISRYAPQEPVLGSIIVLKYQVQCNLSAVVA
jgi:hypothetical protein